MSPYTDLQLRSKLVTSLIFPHLDYCSAVMGDLPGILDTKLQVLLNSCVRYVFQLAWREHVSPYRSQLRWLTVRNRRLYLSTCLLHKTLLTSVPSYLSSNISLEPARSSRRPGPFLKIPFSYSQQLLDSFTIHTANFWNSLPQPIRQSDSLPSFKHLLKQFLLVSESSNLAFTSTPQSSLSSTAPSPLQSAAGSAIFGNFREPLVVFIALFNYLINFFIMYSQSNII